MSKKNILIMFGGISAEHDVSIITGLQALEQIDKELYQPYPIYITQDGEFKYFADLTSRNGFSKKSGKEVSWTRESDKGAMIVPGIIKDRSVMIDAAYLAFHGGTGENGTIQGFLQTLGIPITSSNQESMGVTMNKSLTKDVLSAAGLPVISGVTLTSIEVRESPDEYVEQVIDRLGEQVIIKPAHLGSSIGIEVAKSQIEIRQALQVAAQLDPEILVEELISDFTEYNCAVRFIAGELETSAIEKPLAQDEILSFADKYQRGGGKKSGGNSGMASLVRELPADISTELAEQIRENAKAAYLACRCSGMVRIDFMVTSSQEIFITEINSIPGSMAYYLWEASGYTFTEQITQAIETAITDYKSSQQYNLDYESDIVEKFIATDSNHN